MKILEPLMTSFLGFVIGFAACMVFYQPSWEWKIIFPIVLALCALGLTIYNGMETRNYNRLSVKPTISLKVQGNPYDELNLKLVNNGLGPAIIKEVVFTLEGSIYKWDREEVILKYLVDSKIDTTGGDKTPFYYVLISKYTLKVTDSIKLFHLNRHDVKKEHYNSAVAAMLKVKVKVKYEDFYGNKFEFKST